MMRQRMQVPPKLLVYGMNYAPELIGVGRYTGELGAYLAARGYSVRAIAAPAHYPEWRVSPPFRRWLWSSDRQSGVRVIRCPVLVRRRMGGLCRLLAPLSFALTSAPVVAWHILRHRPDVVLCIEPTLLAAPVAVMAARLTGSRLVLHVQDLEMEAAFAVGHLKGRPLKMLARMWRRMAANGFDRVITVSDAMRARLSAAGVAPCKLQVVRNWVDCRRIQPCGGASPLRRELDIGEHVFVVLYAGVLGRKQALPILLTAARIMASRDRLDDAGAGSASGTHPDDGMVRPVAVRRSVLFVVAGEGPERQRLLQDYGGLPNVRFLPLQPEERLNDLLALADLHVLPQDRRVADLVLPSKLGGMLASGRPILAMADKGTELHDFLAHGAIPDQAALTEQAALIEEAWVAQSTGCMAGVDWDSSGAAAAILVPADDTNAVVEVIDTLSRARFADAAGTGGGLQGQKSLPAQAVAARQLALARALDRDVVLPRFEALIVGADAGIAAT